MTSVPEQATTLLAKVVYELHMMKPLIPTYIHLLLSAVFPIYTASHAALARPSSAAPAKKNKGQTDEEIEEAHPQIETLTPSDAVLFPILAGCTLSGLYLALKYLQDPEWLNWFLGLYFSGVGFFFMVRFVKDGATVLRSLVFPKFYRSRGVLWSVSKDVTAYHASGTGGQNRESNMPSPVMWGTSLSPRWLLTSVWSLRRILFTRANLEMRLLKALQITSPIDILDVVSIVVSLIAVGYHTFIDKPWFLTNILGFSFCYGSLQFVTPGSAMTASLILSALLFYDIYFVFFTPMMVTVATKLDVPIKLLFPRPDGCVLPVGAAEGSPEMEEYLRCIAKKRTMAMLGLGDIVVPGMVLAFALRFDLYLFYLRKAPKSGSSGKSDETKAIYSSATGYWGERFWTNWIHLGRSHDTKELEGKRFPKTYFHATIFGYVAGMVATVGVMQIFQHAQPALLYLVPGVLISLWTTALVKGDLKLLWDFTEVFDEEEEKKKKTAKEKEKKLLDGEKKQGSDDNGEAMKNLRDTKDALHDKKDEDQSMTTSPNDDKELSNQPEKKRKQKKKEDNTKPQHIFYFAISIPPPSPLPEGEEDEPTGSQDGHQPVGS